METINNNFRSDIWTTIEDTFYINRANAMFFNLDEAIHRDFRGNINTNTYINILRDINGKIHTVYEKH